MFSDHGACLGSGITNSELQGGRRSEIRCNSEFWEPRGISPWHQFTDFAHWPAIDKATEDTGEISLGIDALSLHVSMSEAMMHTRAWCHDEGQANNSQHLLLTNPPIEKVLQCTRPSKQDMRIIRKHFAAATCALAAPLA